MNNINELYLKLNSLCVFNKILEDDVVKSLMNYISNVDKVSVDISVKNYSKFVSRLYEANGGNLTKYIQRLINDDENVFIKYKSKEIEIPDYLKESVKNEILILSETAKLSSTELKKYVEWNGTLPDYDITDDKIEDIYFERVSNISKYGYGIYSRYYMFYLNPKNKIMPVKNPDNTKLADLIDYEYEKKVILDNTIALLKGKPAANILLTGDAGTGKSSTVKAVVNELHDEGLRILEVRKEQLHEIPALLNELTSNPLKFILFIDDLSFSKDDDNFSVLKAILEGSVSSKSQNVVIYATSNRRRLVKEKFSDREGDEIHVNDSMQEIISLSERFGIQLTFNRPDKATYLNIVHHLVDALGIKYDKEKLDIVAERYALMRGTRSARAAKQFADGVESGNINDIY